jgi:hypothetical protein
LRQSATSTGGIAHTFSVFAKAGERGTLRMLLPTTGNTSGFTGGDFDLIAGTASFLVAATGSIVTVGNGWYRCSITVTTAVGATIPQTRLVLGTTAYTGDGFSGIFIWGTQLEAGAFPTSYIPTVASQVTRSADNASMTGTNFSSWYRQDEGSFFATASIGQGAFPYLLYAGDGTDNNRHIIFRSASPSNLSTTFTMISSQGNIIQSNLTAFSANSTRFAYGYKLDDYAGVTDLTATKTDISGTVPTIDRLFIGSRFGTTFFANGTIKKLAFYPKRLTNVQLEAITT